MSWQGSEHPLTFSAQPNSMAGSSLRRHMWLAGAVLLGAAPWAHGFLSPALWSRLRASLRSFNHQHESWSLSDALVTSQVGGSGIYRAGRICGAQRLMATASFGAGDFGDEISYAEMREQLSAYEAQLAAAMDRGRYDEAKQLVNEITVMKEYMEKHSAGGFRNPFAGAFLNPEPLESSTALTMPEPQTRRSRTGLGAFGSSVNRKTRGPAGKGGVAGPGREAWGQVRRARDTEMPMEAVRKRHSDITAYGIRVEVFCFFQPGASRPQDNLYSFQCNIRITNTNPTDVQLLGRELKIYKADGSAPEYGPASQQLESQPVVGPSSVYMYMSEFGITCVPEDRRYLGRIEGHFNVGLENAVVKVPIAPFWLEIPGDTLVLA